jgi:hypothetical protein
MVTVFTFEPALDEVVEAEDFDSDLFTLELE